MSNKVVTMQDAGRNLQKLVVNTGVDANGNIVEGAQKANTVSATPVSQISNLDPFAAIMTPKQVVQPAPSSQPNSPVAQNVSAATSEGGDAQST